MRVLNIKTISAQPLIAEHCDRLYDLLLVKAYGSNIARARQVKDRFVDYDISLVAECDSRGVVTDIQLADQHQ